MLKSRNPLNHFGWPVILFLTIYKVVKVARRSSSRLIKALYRDGAFYYVYILRECTTPVSFAAFLKSPAVISIGNIIVPIAGPVG